MALQLNQHGCYSSHVGTNAFSGHQDFTPQAFADSALLQRRARTFLRRELQVFPQDFEEGLSELAEWVASQTAVDRVDAARAELESRGLVA